MNSIKALESAPFEYIVSVQLGEISLLMLSTLNFCEKALFPNKIKKQKKILKIIFIDKL
jgi:hypothetical protein